MCIRFVRSRTRESFAYANLFGLLLPDVPPSYNVAPTHTVPAVRCTEQREAVLMRWGLVPSWSRDGKSRFTARAETAAEKPSFRSAFRKRRCLIPADGYFEWQATSAGKQPYLFRVRGGEPFAF